MSVKESQVEEVLATYPDIAAEVLGIRATLTLISRQKILPSNDRIDLLFTHGWKLVLVELKIVPFHISFLNQVVGYRDEIRRLQIDEALLNGDIDTYLLCPAFSRDGMETCVNQGVIPVEYNPQYVQGAQFQVTFGSPQSWI